MKSIFIIFATVLFSCMSASAQFRMVKNSHLQLADASPKINESSATATLTKFLETARKGKREQWEKTLSKKIELDNQRQKKTVDSWYKLLNRSDIDFYIYPEVTSSNSNKLIYYYTIKSSRQSTKKNTITLVREESSWKVLQMAL